MLSIPKTSELGAIAHFCCEWLRVRQKTQKLFLPCCTVMVCYNVGDMKNNVRRIFAFCSPTAVCGFVRAGDALFPVVLGGGGAYSVARDP